jgi:hypothetical protein
MTEPKYDFYSFGGDSKDPLDVENFKKSKNWGLQLFNARQCVAWLDEYQGTTAFGEKYEAENKFHIDKLNIPSQDPKIIIVLDYHLFKNHGNVKPSRLLKTCSRWNEEFDAQIYICAYIHPLSDEHSKLLARFDDPAFQRVFEGLFVLSAEFRNSECSTLVNEVFSEVKEEEIIFMYADRRILVRDGTEVYIPTINAESVEKHIRKELEEK